MFITVRGLNILLICSVRLICQLDRLAWSFLVVAMSAELGWSTVEQGHIKAAFASGYLWLQIAGGVAGDRFGNKFFQSVAILACAVGMAAVPSLISVAGPGASHEMEGHNLDRNRSFTVARWAYFTMGLSCGPQHPTGTAMLAKWCLPQEKAWVSSMDALSSIVGSLVSTLVIGVVIEVLGWRATMHAMAICTTILLVFFCTFASNTPACSSSGRVGWLRMSEEECRLFEDAGMLKPTSHFSAQIADTNVRKEHKDSSPIKSVVTWASLQQAKPTAGSSSLREQLGQQGRPNAVQELFSCTHVPSFYYPNL